MKDMNVIKVKICLANVFWTLCDCKCYCKWQLTLFDLQVQENLKWVRFLNGLSGPIWDIDFIYMYTIIEYIILYSQVTDNFFFNGKGKTIYMIPD